MTKKEFNIKLNQVKKDYHVLINSLEYLGTSDSYKLESAVDILINCLNEFKITCKNYNCGMKSNRLLSIYFAKKRDKYGNHYHLIIDEENKQYGIEYGSTSCVIGFEHRNAFENQKELFSYAKTLESYGYTKFNFYEYSKGRIK